MRDAFVVGVKLVERADEKKDDYGKEEISCASHIVAAKLAIGFSFMQVEFARQEKEERVSCKENSLSR